MHRLPSRTSITTDEAVGILLGLITVPIDYEPSYGAEDEEDDGPVFCLDHTLADESDALESKYVEAKLEKQPAHVIAEKYAAMQDYKALRPQAYAYLCAINDELNKGEQSVLKVDKALSNAADTYITLHSFKQWVKRVGGDLSDEQPGAAGPTGSRPASLKHAAKPKPRTKMRDQEKAILDEIRRQGSDPRALPPQPKGKPGIRFAVSKALNGLAPFEAKTSFKKAWERLSAQELIVFKAGPSSPQKDDGGDL